MFSQAAYSGCFKFLMIVGREVVSGDLGNEASVMPERKHSCITRAYVFRL
jgi:hypothetical protein